MLSLVPWPLVCAAAALLTVLAGVVPPVALATVAWVQAPDLGFWTVIGAGVRGWLLAHGARIEVGENVLGIVPLGVSLLIVLAGSGLAAVAAQQARTGASEDFPQRERRDLVLRVASIFVATYVVCVLVAAALTDTGSQTGVALLGGIVLGAVSALVGAGRAVGWDPTQWWPQWARAVPRAIGAALCVMGATGALVTGIALWQHRGAVVDLHNSLVPGVAGGIALLVLQLVWLPNLVIWGASWALGAGFSVGTGTVVSPAHNLTGTLPAIPVLGAIGANGPGPRVALLWLLSGVLAGIVAAWVIVRSRPAARPDETSLVGGLSGVLAGLCFWVLALVSGGDLGVERLVGVGPRLVPLAVMAPTVMGISGLVTGLVLGLLQARPMPVEANASPLDQDEESGHGG